MAGNCRIRRDSRDAARRSRPSSSSSSARVAIIAATARPVGVAVSIPSRKARKRIPCSTEFSDGPRDFGDGPAKSVNGSNHHGIAGAGVVEQGRQARAGCSRRTGELVRKYPISVDAGGGERGELCVEVLAGGADSCVAQGRRHTDDCRLAPTLGIRDTRCETRNETPRPGITGRGSAPLAVVSFL